MLSNCLCSFGALRTHLLCDGDHTVTLSTPMPMLLHQSIDDYSDGSARCTPGAFQD
jgi:hypothetical protein